MIDRDIDLMWVLFRKLRCGSEVKMKDFSTFILHFSHLAVTLHPNI